MCKKLVLGVLAVVVGVAFVKSEWGSVVRVWWKDLRAKAERKVSPETRLEQLCDAIDKIDADLEKNIRVIARQEVDRDELVGKQTQLANDMKGLLTALDSKQTNVSYQGRTVPADRLRNDLRSKTQLYKANEKLLDAKNKALDVANERITRMQTERDRLRVEAAELAARLELSKLQDVEDRAEVDDGSVGRANQLAARIRRSLDEKDKVRELRIRHGLSQGTPAATQPRTEITDAEREARAILTRRAEAVAGPVTDPDD